MTQSTDTNARARFEVSINNSCTLWDLKKMIGKEIRKTTLDGGATYALHPDPETGKLPIPIHPATIRVFQMSTSKDIKDTRNGDTLKDINIAKSENLSFYRKNAYLTRKAQLIQDNEKGEPEFTTRAENVISEVFERFSDYSEDFDRRIMTKWHCINYTHYCTGTESGEHDPRVTNFMDKFSFMGQKEDFDGNPLPEVVECEQVVDLQGYKNFVMHCVCNAKEERYRANLRKLGYNNDLSK